MKPTTAMMAFTVFSLSIAALAARSPMTASTPAGSTSSSSSSNTGDRRQTGSDGGGGASQGGAAVTADRHPDSVQPPASPLEKAQLGDVVTLQGKLKCDLGGANTGEACALLFLDGNSGRTFQLTSQAKAMRVYFDSSNGSHDVTLQGKVMGVETLEVVDVSQR